MWQFVINYIRSLWSYQDLSPDLWRRRRINAQLRGRPKLSLQDWIRAFTHGKKQVFSPHVLAFIYTHLPKYSGLDIGRIRPTDRLIEDLQLPLVCWFDWSYQLCDDFFTVFQIDISEEFDESLLETVGDLVYFLNKHLQYKDSVPSA